MKNANRKNSKKVAIGALSICLVAAMAIGGTMAFLTDSEQVTNNFSLGDLDITIDEPSWDDDGTPDDPGTPDVDESEPGDGEDLVPGDSKDKDPTVEAVEGDSYMRVVMTIKDRDTGDVITDTDRLNLILQTIRYAEGNAIEEGKSYKLADLAAYSTVNSAFTKDTAKSTAGVYYYNYNNILKKGDKAVLFTDVVIPTDWNQEEINALRGVYYVNDSGVEVSAETEGATKKYHNYKIELQAQAIQSENFENAAAAYAALDGEINATPAATAQKNYGTVDGDSDTEYVIAGRTVTP